MKHLKTLFLTIWQIPQEIVGFLIFFICCICTCKSETWNGRIVTRWDLGSGLSLGNFIFVSKISSETTLYHEYGHTIQSSYLGPLYLLIIGLPSIVWCAFFGFVYRKTRNGYYKFYTEKWADKLGQITRQFD